MLAHAQVVKLGRLPTSAGAVERERERERNKEGENAAHITASKLAKVPRDDAVNAHVSNSFHLKGKQYPSSQ
jgi:hypothetical protein